MESGRDSGGWRSVFSLKCVEFLDVRIGSSD
jgi:hypothetical protein